MVQLFLNNLLSCLPIPSVLTRYIICDLSIWCGSRQASAWEHIIDRRIEAITSSRLGEGYNPSESQGQSLATGVGLITGQA